MTKSDDKKVPALRFKGFTDDWEQRKFESLIYPEKIKNKNNLQLPAYSISNKNGFIAQTDQFGKDNTYSKTDKKTNYIVNPGAFAYNPARINVGSIGYQNLATPVLVSSLYEVFKTNSQINDLFLIYWFKTDKFFNQIKKYEEGGVRQYYFLDKLLFSEIIIPKDAREQQKISKILKKLDYLFSLQQRKLEQLNLLQRALLQRIFANRNLQPDLRFTNFSGAWEQHKLGNMANILRGASPRPIKDKKWFDTNSRIGWIRISDVTSQNGRVYTLGQHLSKKGQEKTHVVSSQTLLLSIAASVGYPVITYVETGVHDGFIIFDKPKFNLDFMFFKLQSIQNIWSKYGQPGSQVNINSSIVANTSISIPNIKEQKKISILLKKIEENIHLQQNKINKLQELKRSFLQNMFI